MNENEFINDEIDYLVSLDKRLNQYIEAVLKTFSDMSIEATEKFIMNLIDMGKSDNVYLKDRIEFLKSKVQKSAKSGKVQRSKE